MCSKDYKTIYSARYLIELCLGFGLTSNYITIPELWLLSNGGYLVKSKLKFMPAAARVKRARSHNSPRIQPMNILFVLHQSDFNYVAKICPIKCLTLKKHIQYFQENLAFIRVYYRIPPTSNQVMRMISGNLATKFCNCMSWAFLHFVLHWQRHFYLSRCSSPLGQGDQKVIQYIFTRPILCPKWSKVRWN